MAEGPKTAPDAPSLGGKLGEIKETLTIDVKKSMENLKELLDNLKKLQAPLKNFSKVSGEVTKTFVKIKKEFGGPDGTIALFKKFGKEFAGWVKQLETVKRITPAFEKMLGQFGKLKPQLDKLNPVLQSANANLQGVRASISSFSSGNVSESIGKVTKATKELATSAKAASGAWKGNVAESISKATQATKEFTTSTNAASSALKGNVAESIGKATKATKEFTTSAKAAGGAWKLVGSALAAVAIGPMASFFNFLSNKLNPELSHITGSVKQQSEAMLDMRVNVITLSKAFEEGNKQWGDAFQQAMEKMGALLTGSISPALAEHVGYWTGLASVATRATGAVLGLLAPLVQIGGAIGVLRAGLKIQAVQSFTKQIFSTEKAVTSLSGVMKGLSKLFVHMSKEAIRDTGQALAGLWGVMRKGITVLKGLLTAYAPLRIALIALTTVAAVGSLFKVAKAWASNTEEIEKNYTAIEKLRIVNKELADGLEAQFKSLRQQAEGLKLQRLALADNPIVQVFETKIRGQEDLERIRQQLKQIDELLKKHPDITKEIKAVIQKRAEIWGDVISFYAKENNAIQELHAGLRVELELRQRNYEQQQLSNQVSQQAIDLQLQQLRMAQQGGYSPLTGEQARAREVSLEIERAQLGLKAAQEGQGFAKDRVGFIEKSVDDLKALKKAAGGLTAAQLEQRLLAELKREQARHRSNIAFYEKEATRTDELSAERIKEYRHRASVEAADLRGAQGFEERLRAGGFRPQDMDVLIQRQQQALEEAKQQGTLSDQEIQRQQQNIESLQHAYADITSELTLQENALTRNNTLLEQQFSLVQNLHRMRQEATAQELTDVQDRLQLTDLSPVERSTLEERQVTLLQQAREQALEAEQAITADLQRQITYTQQLATIKEQQQKELAQKGHDPDRQKELAAETAALKLQAKTLEEQKKTLSLSTELRRADTRLRAEQNALDERALELQIQQKDIQQQELQAEQEALDQETQLHGLTLDRQRKQLAIQQRIIKVEQEKLAILRTQTKQKVAQLEADLKSQQVILAQLEAQKAGLSGTALEQANIGIRRQEQTIRAIEQQLHAQQGTFRQQGIELERLTTRAENLGKAIERVGAIEIDLKTPFAHALDTAYNVIVYKVGKMKDVFNVFKESLAASFKEGFRRALTEKFNVFDPIFAKNFLKDLPAIAMQGIAKIGQGFQGLAGWVKDKEHSDSKGLNWSD